MSDLTSPAASSIALPVVAAPPSVNAPGVPSFAAFCEVMLGKIALPGAKPKTGDGDRQADAATGSILPEKDKPIDPALVWLFGAQPVALPAPPPPVATTATPASPASLDTAEFTGPVAPDILIASGGPVRTEKIEPPVILPADEIPASAKLPAIDLPVAKPVNETDATPQPIKLPLVPLRPPVDRTAAPPAAVALPALFALSMTAARADRDEQPSPLASATAPLSPPTTALSVAPMADAQRQMLDMGRQDWPQKMIDHIEALRDNANANDTSIRLKPEALGRVDIALKTHDSGAISVRFTAEQPTTRTLLVDAAPQLAAAAEARGIRLSGTSVDLSGQGDQRSQPQADRAQPITNRLATPRGDDNQAVDDGRIA